MENKDGQAALMSALTTDVLQTAASATVTEAGARTSLYVFSLSSSLVALGFVSQSRETFHLFAAAVLPALFILGVFTTIRLVDTGLENLQFLRGIARIRGYYRTLTPEAPVYFSAERGRWPEAQPPWSGALIASLTTAASMIALINSIVAGTGVTLLANGVLGAVARIKPKLAVYTHFTRPRREDIPEVSIAEIISRTRAIYSGPLAAGADLMSISIGDSVTVKRFVE